ncbi:MAG: hypothetical protein R2731_00290 [Nocardioides sp.]
MTKPDPAQRAASPSFQETVAGADQPVADLSKAPLPTEKTLKMRRSIPLQLTRFAVFNARIMKMVLKGH